MIAVRHGRTTRPPTPPSGQNMPTDRSPERPRSGFFFGGRRPGAICKAQKAPAVMVTGAKLCTQPTRALGCGSADSNGLSRFGSRGQRQARGTRRPLFFAAPAVQAEATAVLNRDLAARPKRPIRRAR